MAKKQFEIRYGHAIVVGYGPVGRLVAERIEKHGLAVTILELNLETVERQLNLDRQVCYGDVLDPDSLRTAGIERTDALVLAIPNERVAIEACRIARRLQPDIFIAARTNFFSQGMLATAAGADAVVVEEVVTAEAMRQAVAEALFADEPRP